MNSIAKKLRTALIFVACVIAILALVTFFRFVIGARDLDQFGPIESAEIKTYLMGQWIQNFSYFVVDISQSLLCLLPHILFNHSEIPNDPITS